MLPEKIFQKKYFDLSTTTRFGQRVGAVGALSVTCRPSENTGNPCAKVLLEIVGDVGDKNVRKWKSKEELGKGMGNLPFYLSLLSIQFHTDNTDKPLKPPIGAESGVGVVSAVSVGR